MNSSAVSSRRKLPGPLVHACGGLKGFISLVLGIEGWQLWKYPECLSPEGGCQTKSQNVFPHAAWPRRSELAPFVARERSKRAAGQGGCNAMQRITRGPTLYEKGCRSPGSSLPRKERVPRRG